MKIEKDRKYVLHNISNGDLEIEVPDGEGKATLVVPGKGNLTVSGALLSQVPSKILDELQAPVVSAHRQSVDGEKLEPPEAQLIVSLAG